MAWAEPPARFRAAVGKRRCWRRLRAPHVQASPPTPATRTQRRELCPWGWAGSSLLSSGSRCCWRRRSGSTSLCDGLWGQSRARSATRAPHSPHPPWFPPTASSGVIYGGASSGWASEPTPCRGCTWSQWHLWLLEHVTALSLSPPHFTPTQGRDGVLRLGPTAEDRAVPRAGGNWGLWPRLQLGTLWRWQAGTKHSGTRLSHHSVLGSVSPNPTGQDSGQHHRGLSTAVTHRDPARCRGADPVPPSLQRPAPRPTSAA